MSSSQSSRFPAVSLLLRARGIHLFIYPIFPPIYLSMDLSVYLSIYLSIYLVYREIEREREGKRERERERDRERERERDRESEKDWEEGREGGKRESAISFSPSAEAGSTSFDHPKRRLPFHWPKDGHASWPRRSNFLAHDFLTAPLLGGNTPPKVV